MQPSHVHQHLCCSPILHCLTPTTAFSTWLTFVIKKKNLSTCGKGAPTAKAPAMLKCPHRGRNDGPCPMSSSGGLAWLHPHTRRAQGTEQHQPTAPSSKEQPILPSDLPCGNPFFGDTQQGDPQFHYCISNTIYHLISPGQAQQYCQQQGFEHTRDAVFALQHCLFVVTPQSKGSSHSHPLCSTHPLENHNQKTKQNQTKTKQTNKQSKPIPGAREYQSRSTKALKIPLNTPISCLPQTAQHPQAALRPMLKVMRKAMSCNTKGKHTGETHSRQ